MNGDDDRHVLGGGNLTQRTQHRHRKAGVEAGKGPVRARETIQ